MAKRVYIEGLMDPENRVDGAETIQIDHPLEDPNFVRTPPRDRSEVIPWDETLAIEAIIMSLRSKDPSTRVGAVITNSNNRILSSGYNGTPVGIDDDKMIYNKQLDQDGNELPLNRTKYGSVAHAEENAINNFIGVREQMRGGNIYTTLFPCNNCAKMIVASGITKVFFNEGPRDPSSGETQSALYNLEIAGVKVYQVVPSVQSVSLTVQALLSRSDDTSTAKLIQALLSLDSVQPNECTLIPIDRLKQLIDAEAELKDLRTPKPIPHVNHRKCGQC